MVTILVKTSLLDLDNPVDYEDWNSKATPGTGRKGTKESRQTNPENAVGLYTLKS